MYALFCHEIENKTRSHLKIVQCNKTPQIDLVETRRTD